MELLPAYVSYDFLEELAKGAQVNLLEINAALDIKSKAELVQLILNGMSVQTDKSFEEIDELIKEKRCNELLVYIIGASGRKRVEWKPLDFEAIKNKTLKRLEINPFTQFFLSNNQSNNTEQIEKKTGFLFHHISKPSTYQRLSQFRVEYFNYRDKKNWSFIHQYKIPHHSIIIVDPHLLRDEKNEHVVQLIKNLINTELTSVYHITLFLSKSCIVKNLEDKASTMIPPRFELIKLRLKAEFTNIHFAIEFVVYNGKDFHDRYIITNNTMIYSGYGFDLINNNSEAKKQTNWVVINHAKIQDDKNGNVKTHFNTVINYLTQLKKWIAHKESYSSPIIDNPILQTAQIDNMGKVE